MGSGYDDWDIIYRRYPLRDLPWERGRPRESLVRLVEEGKISPGRALDPCSGAGTNDIYLAEKGFAVTAMDISARAVEYAREKARASGHRLDLRVGDFTELPFADGEFDFVLDSGCFHHVRPEDRGKYVRGVSRVLAQGGRYLLICFSERNGPAWNHFTAEEIRGLFSDYFEILEMEHSGSVEGDGAVRHFHNALMEKR
ncbi:MAG: hypothetical protein Kow0025_18160 [Thermodesulfovibrionales bacterium]